MRNKLNSEVRLLHSRLRRTVSVLRRIVSVLRRIVSVLRRIVSVLRQILTEVVLFGPKRFREKLSSYIVTLDGISLGSSTTVRNLGVI